MTLKSRIPSLLLAIPLACGGIEEHSPNGAGLASSRADAAQSASAPQAHIGRDGVDANGSANEALAHLFGRIDADLKRLAPEDWRFTRYVTTSGPDERAALSEGVNVVSTAPGIASPVEVGWDGNLYRIDLRQLAWDRAVTLKVRGRPRVRLEWVEHPFPDGWEAIVDRSGLALPPLVGETVTERTRTGTPVLAAVGLLGSALTAEVYYGLTGIDPQAVPRQLEGVHVPLPGEDGFIRLAINGFHRTISGAFRVVRNDGGNPVWVSDGFDGSSSLLSTPLSYNRPGDLIYQLPNGLAGFYIATGGFSPQIPRSDSAAADRLGDCQACHFEGPLHAVDTMREYAKGNPLFYDEQTLDDVDTYWPTQADLDTVIAADRRQFSDAREAVGFTEQSAHAVSRMVARFREPLEAATVAGYLHAPQVLVEALLEPLSGAVTPELVSERYGEWLCSLYVGASVAPDGC